MLDLFIVPSNTHFHQEKKKKKNVRCFFVELMIYIWILYQRNGMKLFDVSPVPAFPHSLTGINKKIEVRASNDLIEIESQYRKIS